MWCAEVAGLAKPGSTGCGTRATWLVIGPDRALLDRQVVSLARFGVVAEAADPLATPSPVVPVMCDGRSRPLLGELLSQVPLRPAPVLVFGINAAAARAADPGGCR